MKRVVVVSDFHCGHIVGLTPPGWDNDRPKAHLKKSYLMRRAIWDYYSQTLKALQPIDILIVNGDCIDGRGEKSGGTELLYIDRDDQVAMAVEAIQEAGAKKIVMSYGTGYHTGREEDWERQIAKGVNATKIGSVDTIEVNGIIFNYRHFIGGSQVPYGRHTAIARDRVWNVLWAERGEYPKADVVLRSHVHYHCFSGDAQYIAMTTPGLQGYGSKFGARNLSGIVDIGLVHFDVEKGGLFRWEAHITRMPTSHPVSL